jgi:NAD(P)H-dependent flavin oxidoreductase YrpB (nitropropane dioxygenase family)
VCLREAVPVVSTFWGDPAPVSRRIRDAGALHMHTVGSVPEARHAADCGVDVIVAQGWEAGGHVRGTTTTMVLVPSVVDAVGPVPVMAAGGISDGRGVAAALVLGAQGAWLGTRFLAAAQAGAHPMYQDRLVAEPLKPSRRRRREG